MLQSISFACSLWRLVTFFENLTEYSVYYTLCRLFDSFRSEEFSSAEGSLASNLVPRLLCVGGEKKAWYTLFVHAQFPQDSWVFVKYAHLH